MAQCNVQTLLKNAACFGCLSPGEWDVLELQLLCEILSAGQLPPASVFVSPLLVIASEDYYVTVPHGLGRKPSFIRAVTVALANDPNLNLLAGQEVELFSWDWLGGPFAHSRWAIESDATNIYAAHACWTCDPANQPNLMISGDINPSSDITQYRLKFYAF